MTPVTAPPTPQLSQLKAFMKAEPKALGTVQIMIGASTFLFGLVLSTFFRTPVIVSGITVWGSLIFIISGALSGAAANKSNSCVVKAALGMNVVSAVVAGIAIILFTVDLIRGSEYIVSCQSHKYEMSENDCKYSIHLWNGIYVVLIVFSLLEFTISVSTSDFACKAICCTETSFMYSQPMYAQPMNPQPMNPQPINPQLMFNLPSYNPQAPQHLSVKV